MRAAGVTEFGGPEALQLVDVPAEPLGAGEVRLRVAAATVNPTDTYARARRLRRARPGEAARRGCRAWTSPASWPRSARASTTWRSVTT